MNTKSLSKNQIRLIATFLIVAFVGSETSVYAMSPSPVQNSQKYSETQYVQLIPDAHGQPGAQKNLSRDLEKIIEQGRVREVWVEGGEGVMESALLASYPNTEKRDLFLSELVEEGDLSGVVPIAVRYPHISFQGIEDTQLYLKHLKTYRMVQNSSELRQENLRNIQSELDSRKQKYYSSNQLQLEELRKQYLKDSKGLSKYLEALMKYHRPVRGSPVLLMVQAEKEIPHRAMKRILREVDNLVVNHSSNAVQ